MKKWENFENIAYEFLKQNVSVKLYETMNSTNSNIAIINF